MFYFDNHPRPRFRGDRLRWGAHLIKNNGMPAFVGMMFFKLRRYLLLTLLALGQLIDKDSLVFLQLSFAAASTSSTWPGTLTLRQLLRMLPVPSIRKVARSMPIYLRP